MSTIGLIGHGVVGQAVEHGFAPYFDICIYDKHKTPRVGSSGRVCESIHEVVQLSTGPIFICVPTPMNQDWYQYGACDTSIVESVIEETVDQWKRHGVEFLTDHIIKCPDDDMRQIFTKPIDYLGGVIIELIERGDKGFCQNNVKDLMESTEII